MKATLVTITAAHAGQRLDNFLIARLKGVPKSRIYKAIRKGEVRVDGGRAKQTLRLELGQTVRVPPIQLVDKPYVMPPSERWEQAMRSCVIHQDDAVMLINKPAGMAVHAGTGIERGLIENIKASPLYGEEWELVHRIDRETSGLLVLAKRGEVLRQLQEQFRQREVKKGYLLWVKGSWDGGEQVVEQPLLRYEGGNGERRVKVDRLGQAAKTLFRPLRVLPDRSLLWAAPETGRTHQIRVHAAYLGYPILGDAKYGDNVTPGERMFLHAAQLIFADSASQWSVCACPDACWRD